MSATSRKLSACKCEQCPTFYILQSTCKIIESLITLSSFYLDPEKNVPIFQIIPYHLESMDFGTEIDGTEDFFQMFWPIIVSHKIDEDSPLWEISARDLTSKMQFEIVLTMEGITPETGNTIQVTLPQILFTLSSPLEAS